MRGGDGSVLEAFGELLQSHTRLEERALFGLIEKKLTQPRQERLASCLGSGRA
jgi:hemerythrin-like domain-containing protein